MRIGVDLGGTKIEGVILDSVGNTLFKKRIPTPQNNYAQTLRDIKSLVDFLQGQVDEIATVGIGTPGARSELNGRMKNCNSTCLNGQDFLGDVSEILDQRVRIANDADCFTLSEAVDGAAKNDVIVLGVIIGTGVGGGVSVNRALLQGPNSIAGEWGHNPLPGFLAAPRSSTLNRTDDRPCYCGKFNCVETFLSGPGFQKDYRARSGDDCLPAEIVGLAQQGHVQAQASLTHYFDYLAMGLAAVINVIDPHVIVLGGGMSNIDGLVPEVTQLLPRYVFSDQVLTRVTLAKYGDSSGVRGAAWLW